MDSNSMMFSPSNISTLAEQGLLQTSVDSESGFGKPLAASTVARVQERNQKYGYDDRGSFTEGANISDYFSASGQFTNKEQEQMKLSFNTLDQSQKNSMRLPGNHAERYPMANGPQSYDLDASTRSSLGILPAGVMDDLSSSILPFETPCLLIDKPPKPATHLTTQTSASQKSNPYSLQQDSGWQSGAQSSRGSLTDSSEWSGTTRNSSKSQVIDTVKKRPVMRQDEGIVAGNVRASLAFGKEPMSCIDDDLEAEASVHEVVIADDELLELDEDFGEFEELEVSLTSCDDDHMPQDKKSSNGVCVNEEFDMLTLLRSQKYRSDGSEIDTEDELEMARKTLKLDQDANNTWEASGNNKEQQKFNRPGLEGWSSEENSNGGLRQSADGDVVVSPVPGDGGGGGDGTSSSESDDNQPSLSVQSHHLRKRFQQNIQLFQPQMSRSSPQKAYSMEQRVRPMGDDLSERGYSKYSLIQTSQDSGLDSESSGLQSKFLAPMRSSQNNMTSLAMSVGPGLENSTFNLEDMLKCTEDNKSTSGACRQEASGFNASDQGMYGDVDPFACIDSSFGSFGLQPENGNLGTSAQQTEAKHYVTEGSPVYVDETGECVTDLAFHVPLSQEAAEQQRFLMSEKKATTGSLGIPLQEEDFQAGDAAMDMLDEDEKDFEKENIFIQDDKMIPAATTPESWAYQSVMSHSHSKYSLTEEEAQAYMRISIGEFIGSRSEALGSLDYNYRGPRPEFGMKVTTPPQNRHPIALIDTHISVNSGAPNSPQTRTEGVGNEEGHDDINDKTFQLTELDTPQTTSAQEQNDDTLTHGTTESSFNGDVFSSETSSTCSSIDSTIIDRSATMRVSEISRFLNTLPSDTKPNVLAGMIMELSNQKTSKDVKQSLKNTKTTLSTGSSESIMTEKSSKRASDTCSQAVLKSLIPVRVGTSLSGLERKCRLKNTKEGAKVRSMSADAQIVEDSLKNKPIKSKVAIDPSNSKNADNLNGEMKIKSIQKTVADGEESDNRQIASSSNIGGSASPETTATQAYPNVDWHSPRPSLGGKYLDSQFQQNLSEKFDTMSIMSERNSLSDFCDKPSLNLQSDDRLLKIAGLPVGGEKRDVLPADGEASVLFSKRNSTLAQNFSPPVKQTAADSQRENWRKEPSLPTSVSFNSESSGQSNQNEKCIRSVSDNITGHHIPDGTEYSAVSDSYHLYNNTGTREEVVGTADNKLVDSRVFNVVGYNPKSGHILQVSQENNSENRKSVPSTNMGVHSISVAATSRPMGVQTVLSRPNLNTNCNAPMNSIPQITTVSLTSNTYSTNVVQSSMPARTFEEFKSGGKNISHAQTHQSVEHTYHSHYWTQPQPPIDSYKHNLLPTSAPAPDKPTLLTKQSLHETEFAKKYLQAGLEHCDNICDDTGNGNISNMSIPLDQFNELRPSLSPPPHMGNNMLDAHQDLSILAHSPAYQSTPFTKVMTGSRMPPAHTVLTSSTIHSVWSTGPSEMATPHSKTDNMYQGRRLPEQFPEVVQKRQISVEAPGVLRFSDVCCVGISTKTILPLKNPTDRWLECLLQVQNLIINGQPVHISQYFPFDMKKKVIIEPHTTEDISVIFMPKVPGVHVAQLQVISQLFLPEHSVSPDRIPVNITLQAVAERAQIQVITEKQEMNFGSVKWGTCHCLSLKMVNLGQAMIPLRLAISSNQGSWHCFSFERMSGPDVSIISKSKCPDFPALNKSVVNICLPGSTDNFKASPQEIKVYCRPPDKQWDRALAQRPLDRISARIDIEVDTPSSAVSPISTVQLQAAVGMPKLHTPRNLQVLHLKTVPGKQVQENFILKNVGNMELEVSLSVPQFENAFIIKPKHIIVPPGQVCEGCLSFSPGGTTPSVIETWLLMHEEPDGPLFEIQIKGEVHPEISKSPVVPALISDKRFLSFGGIGIGRAVHQKVTLANKSEQPVQFRVEINSESPDFQLQGTFGKPRDQNRTQEAVLRSLEKHTIHVLYAPSAIKFSTGKLVIRPYETTVKYSIPLCGYGGVSSVVLEGVTMSDRDHYWSDLGEIVSGEHIVRKITVRNVGSRAAYVKILSFQDMRCKYAASPNRVIVEPNEFVLKEKCKLTVAVVFNPSEKEAALCSDRKEVAATVCFFCGDELGRQQYKRALKKLGVKAKIPKQVDTLLHTVNFDNSYMNEEIDSRESLVPTLDAQSDYEQFYYGISKLLLVLTGEPCAVEKFLTWTPRVHTGTLHQHTKSLSDVSLTANIPVNDTNKNVRSSSNPILDGPELCTNDTVKTWIVLPDIVQLTIPSSGISKPKSSKFQIANFSKRLLRFELCWPGHWFSVTPENGIVEPRSSTTVSITASTSIPSNSEDLPWNGNIQVTCDGNYKMLPVQIQADTTKKESCNGDLGEMMSLSSKSITPTVPMLPDTRKTDTGLQLSPDKVIFQSIAAGDTTESTIEIINTERHAVQWVISSFAPAYVKEDEKEREIFRVTYKVFEIKDQFGTLASKQSTKVCIQFMPRSRGAYTQWWEVQSKSDSPSASSSHKVRLQLSGEAFSRTVKERLHDSENSRRKLESKDSERLSSTLYKPIVINGNHLDFPICKVNQQAFCKIELKNQSVEEHAVEVCPPTKPFHIKHSRLQMKSRRYTKFPVEFRPSAQGEFDSQLIFRINNSYDLVVSLHGECV